MASSISPGRVNGRALSSSPLTLIWLAMFGGPTGPAPTFGAPDPCAATGAVGFTKEATVPMRLDRR